MVIDNFELNLLKKQPEAEATEAGTPIFWPRDAKSRLIRKDPDAEKDRGQEEKETTEDEWFDSIINSKDTS